MRDLKHVKEILDEIRSVPGTKDKKEVIKKHITDIDFLQVVDFALSQNMSFGLNKLPDEATPVKGDLFEELNQMSLSRGCTDVQARRLAGMCPNKETREVVTLILNKDLKCGARAKVFNSVRRGWVYQVPYQRYKSFSSISKLDFENGDIVAQMKMDGMFAYLFTGNYGDPFLSRNGKQFSLGEEFQKKIEESWITKVDVMLDKTTVRMGELLVLGPGGKYLPRKEGNGIINSFIAGKGDPDQVDNIRYVTWGFILEDEFYARESKRVYRDVLNIDSKLYEEAGAVILSDTVECKTLGEAMDFYSKMRKRKEEGAMVKDASKLTWKDQQSGTPYGVKLKPEFEAEFEIIGAYPGKKGTKYENMLGGIRVRSSCGLIESNVGGGFSDDERAMGVAWWLNRVGMIVSIKFTGLITDKSDRKTWCFDHGRFVETRFNEKTEADSFEYVKGIMEGK